MSYLSIQASLSRRTPRAIPHVVDKDYVGTEVALVSLQAYFAAVQVTYFYNLEFHESFPHSHHSVQDVFQVNLTPAMVMRYMFVDLDLIDAYPIGLALFTRMNHTNTQLQHLLAGENRHGIKLEITIH